LPALPFRELELGERIIETQRRRDAEVGRGGIGGIRITGIIGSGGRLGVHGLAIHCSLCFFLCVSASLRFKIQAHGVQ
jgi:hypothetical protein